MTSGFVLPPMSREALKEIRAAKVRQKYRHGAGGRLKENATAPQPITLRRADYENQKAAPEKTAPKGINMSYEPRHLGKRTKR